MNTNLHEFRTANAGGGEMQLSAVISANAANLAAIADGEWGLISPFGDHPSPNGSYVQKFSREQGEKVVKTWNSITGTAARVFKNLFHGLGSKTSCPVWDGHPETDKKRWPITKLLAEITDLRLGENGLEGRLTWNAKGLDARTRGPLYPSSLWWHWPPSGNPPAVFPELLESVGLVPDPNISGVPAWTHNTTLASEVEAQSTNNTKENPMNEEQLKALRKALNLPESTDVAKVIETAQSAFQLSTSNATALQTAKTEKSDLENKLGTANGELTGEKTKVTDLTTERDGLRTANTTLIDGILDVFELAGKITPAQKPELKTRFTANGAKPAEIITELKAKTPELNTKILDLNGNRIDISTANARREAFDSEVNKLMKAEGLERNAAYQKCLVDPKLKQLVDAMQNPAAAAK